MWYTCFVCHKTYSHKWNLKRHINTVHMFKVHKCHHCYKEYKRRDYLNRHLKRVHNSSQSSNTFENIADCVTTEKTPDLSSSLNNINHESSEFDDVDSFLDSIDLQSPEASNSVSRMPPTSNNVTMTAIVCTQTEVCSLPPIIHPVHMGTNTTPIFSKDKTTQKGQLLTDTGTSPHIEMISPQNHLQGWDSPITSPLPTPYLDIPSYYTINQSINQSVVQVLNLRINGF